MSHLLKTGIAALFLLAASPYLLADHVMGGEITYLYLGNQGAPGTPYQYELTFNVYVDRNSRNFPTGVEPFIAFGVYDAGNHTLIQSLSLPSTPRPVNPVLPASCNVPSLQRVRTTLNTYKAQIELPYSAAGYYVVYERCCRNQVLNVENYEEVGNTFYAFIASPDYPNSSPVFSEVALPFLCAQDTTVIVNNATDTDGDRLEYQFVTPYTGGSFSDPAPAPVTVYPYPPTPISYPSGYRLNQPFGPNSVALMDSRTGIAQYAAPNLGLFAIAVEIREYRQSANNREVLVGVIRRELQFVVGSCEPNEPPRFSTASTAKVEYSVRAGEEVCFNVEASDPGNQVDITASGDILDGSPQYTGPRATFTADNRPGSTTSRFCWRTNCQVAPGNYTVTVKAVDNGCPPKTNTLIYTIRVLPAPALQPPRIITAGDQELCPGKTAVLSVAAQDGSTYQWKRDGVNVGANAPALSVAEAGKYSLTLSGLCGSVESANTVTITLRSTPPPISVVVNGPTALCPGESTELSLVSPQSAPGVTYQWQKDQVPIPGENQPLLTVSRKGAYRLVVSNVCSSVASNVVLIEESPLPSSPVLLQSFQRCEEGTLTLTVSGNPSGQYRWYETATATTPILGATQASFLTPVLTQTRAYYVSAVQNGCESARTTVTAAILDAPIATAGEDVSIRLGEKVTLQAAGGQSYRWSPPMGLDRTDVAAPVASPTQTTTYRVTVTSVDGCSSTDEVSVEVRQPLGIANAFSPNGDGINDSWEIQNVSFYPNCRVEVFNRWGNKVYESLGYTVPWDGTFRGETLPVTTYFYRIDLQEGSSPVTGPVSIFK